MLGGRSEGHWGCIQPGGTQLLVTGASPGPLVLRSLLRGKGLTCLTPPAADNVGPALGVDLGGTQCEETWERGKAFPPWASCARRGGPSTPSSPGPLWPSRAPSPIAPLHLSLPSSPAHPSPPRHTQGPHPCPGPTGVCRVGGLRVWKSRRLR